MAEYTEDQLAFMRAAFAEVRFSVIRAGSQE